MKYIFRVVARIIVVFAVGIISSTHASEQQSTVLTQMFTWWNQAFNAEGAFTEKDFEQYFSDDIVFVLNGKRSEKGIASLTRRFNHLKESYYSIEMLLPLSEEFISGNKIYTYHQGRAKKNKDDSEHSVSHTMGHVVVKNNKIAFLDFVSIEQADLPEFNIEKSISFNDFLELIYQRRLDRDPVLATKEGAKKNNDRWTDYSRKHAYEDIYLGWLDLHNLHTQFNYAVMDAQSQLDYRVFEADLKLRIERTSWQYHLNPINQIVGLHLEIPGVLMNYHSVDNLPDAYAYISRLQKVGQPIDQFIEFLNQRQRKGFLLPKSLIPRLIYAAKTVISGGDKNALLMDFNRKVESLSLDKQRKDTLLNNAKSAMTLHTIPAYQRLIKTFETHQLLALEDNGVWHMPDGDQFYAFLLRQYTTTLISADEVHLLGLQEVERIHNEMSKIIKKVAFKGGLKQFFEYLKNEPAFYYANTDQGRKDYLLRAQSIVSHASKKIEDILSQAPPNDLIVKRIEPYREKSAPVGFYEAGSRDGKLPGTIYLGMYDMSSASTYDLNALLFHEGIPGHHLQAAVMQSRKNIPSMRQYYVWWSNTAFTEGWALYAEYLAKELGLYEDAYADFGRLAGELWRACRLVVDSGLHAKRWSRQQAIEFLNEKTASSVEYNTRAVDRYLAVPGQATAFKIGMMEILSLREQARSQLKEKFDIRKFHDVLLKNGPIPLQLVREEIETWIVKTNQ